MFTFQSFNSSVLLSCLSAPEAEGSSSLNCDRVLTIYIFDFFSETAEQNLTKLNRKQELIILYQLCVFRANQKTNMACWVAVLSWSIIDFLYLFSTAKHYSTKLDRRQDLNIFCQVCVFRTNWKTKISALASDLLRHFLLLLCNNWTKTWH